MASSYKLPEHDFVRKELSFDATPNRQPYIKLSFFLKKIANISDEEYYRHWETIHADLTLAASAFKDSGIVRYVQVHSVRQLKEKVKTLGLDQMDVQGCSEMYIKDWDSFVKFMRSDEFSGVLPEDSKKFMQMEFKVLVGYENVIFGKAIPDLDGSDGANDGDVGRDAG